MRRGIVISALLALASVMSVLLLISPTGERAVILSESSSGASQMGEFALSGDRSEIATIPFTTERRVIVESDERPSEPAPTYNYNRTIAGTVVNERGEPVDGARVHFTVSSTGCVPGAVSHRHRAPSEFTVSAPQNGRLDNSDAFAVRDPCRLEVFTDKNGKYTFPCPDTLETTVYVNIWKAGYVYEGRSSWDLPGHPLLTKNATIDFGLISLRPAGELRLFIFDCTGAPFAGNIDIQFLPAARFLDDTNREFTLLAAGARYNRATGECTFSSVSPEPLSLKFYIPEDYVDYSYPSILNVAAGSVVSARMVLPRENVVRDTKILFANSCGGPAPPLQFVSVKRLGDGRRIPVDPDFSIHDLAPGDHEIIVNDPRYKKETKIFSPQRGEDPFVVLEGPDSNIQIDVVDAATRAPIESFECTVSFDRAPGEVWSPLNGSFTLNDVPLCPFKVSITAKGYITNTFDVDDAAPNTTLVRSIQLQRDLSVSNLDEPESTIEGDATFRGKLISNKIPLGAGASVSVRSETEMEFAFVEGGEFVIDHLVGGKYKIFAGTGGSAPDVLLDVMDIPAGSTIERTLTIPDRPFGTVTVELTDGKAPLPYYYITIQSPAPQGTADVCRRTDADGKVVFDSVPPGETTFLIQGLNRCFEVSSGVTARVRSGGNEYVTLQLHRVERELDVVDRDGRPAFTRSLFTIFNNGSASFESTASRLDRAKPFLLTMPEGTIKFFAEGYGRSKPIVWNEQLPKIVKITLE